ncbi:pilus assembly protein TadG-related protein [Bradyrhizobium sp.]|uniref:TadE/TadG family type IV pilus assembly protein n=1 Tax=Bradyrhizobium sp. TaxID=376 RepID=UPI0039E2DA13
MRTVRSTVSRFLVDSRGNVAVIFTLALVPILAAIGVAVDYSQANSARTAMQSALDSTALLVAKDAPNLSSSAISTEAANVFAAEYTRTTTSSPSVTATYTAATSSGSTLLLTATSIYPTTFMSIFGYSSLTLNVSSTATWGTNRLRVALALDNTGSMSSSGKLTALKTAASNLITQLAANASTNGDVYISVVPFATDVNIGTSFASSGYIDWSNWSTTGSIENGWTCGSKYNSKTSTMLCGSSNNSTSKWNGCVMDRSQSNDVTSTAPSTSDSTTYYPADQSDWCPQQLAPLSYNWTSLKSTITAMTASGATNQPIGLFWAWQSLLQGNPLNAPTEDSNYNYTKAIILLSDGLNTKDRWYGDGSTQSSQVDARQALLCSNIKATGVIIYTIQVNTDNEATSSILQSCASSTSQFYLLTSASQVISTFSTIGTALSKLRVSQ